VDAGGRASRTTFDLSDRSEHGAGDERKAGDCRRRSYAGQDRKNFDRWPEAAALGEKMDYVSVALGDVRSHAILAEALKRGRPVCGHIYGREFVAPGAASGITDTHEAIDREIADDFLRTAYGCSSVAETRKRRGIHCRRRSRP
jgi:hypothetical protein